MRKRLFGKILSCFLAFVMLLSCMPGNIVSAASLTYYVSKTGSDTENTGTDAQNPFATIAMAVSKLQAGDTLHIAAGTYDEPLVLAGLSDITVIGEAGTIVTGSTASKWGESYPSVLDVEDSSSIDISNINFNLANDLIETNYDSTVYVIDSWGVNIHNCIIEAGSDVAACIQVNANNKCQYTFDSNILKGGSSRGFWAPWGITNNTEYPAIISKFTNNIVSNAVSIDLTPYGSDYKYKAAFAIENNTCLGSFEAASLSDDSSAEADRIIVANNIFSNIHVISDVNAVNYIGKTCIMDSNYVFNTIDEVGFTDAAIGDYSLTVSSLCNDAGTKAYEAATDFLGNVRAAARADIGAFQYGKVYYATAADAASASAEGTFADPKSLPGALAALAPGDTLYLKAGWYYGVVDLSQYANLCGQENAYIYIKNYNDDGVFIYGDSNSNNALTATSVNNYIDISGVTFQFENPKAWRAEENVKLYGVSHFNLHDCSIAGSSYALKISGDSNGVSNNCNIYNNTFIDNMNDLYINGIRDSKIYNNIFLLGEGARIYNYNGSITNTIISNNVFTKALPAISIESETVITDNAIANNIFATADSTITSNVLDVANNNIVDYNYFVDAPSGIGAHNVTGDLYCDGDFHITSLDSVLLNAGNDLYAPEVDRAGNVRIGTSDIGMYEAVGLDVPAVIPDWGKNMVHPALLDQTDLNNVLTDLKNGIEAPDPDDAAIGTSVEHVWDNVVAETSKYLAQDYFLDTRNNRWCLYYPYLMQPSSWYSTSSMQVGDLETTDSFAQRAVVGITQSTYYANFDFKPVSPATANDYIIYSSLTASNPNGIILKMSNSKVYVSDGAEGTFQEVSGLTLEDGKWYNIYITINQSGTGTSSLIIHPRGVTSDFRADFDAFGTASIDGIFVGCISESSIGKAHYDNVLIYDTYVPVVKESFGNLDAWTKNGIVIKSNEAAYPSGVGSYNWTSICGDLQMMLQNMAITYVAKKEIGDADADAYFEKTKQMLLSISHWNRWGDPDELEKASLDIGYLTIGMSYAYDLLYNDLTTDERAVIAKAIKIRGVDKLYEGSTDVNEYGYYDGVSIVTNTTYVQNAALGMACLAVGDVYNTEKELAVTRANFASAYRNGLDEDGAWTEGFIYGDLAIVYALPFHDADNRITGDQEINNKYLGKIIDYVIYNMCPGGKYYSNIADNARLSYQYKKIMEFYVNHDKNKYTAWALKRLASLPNSNDMLSLVWFPFNATIVEPTEATVELGKLFGDIGVAALKTGWGTTDSLMTLKSSKLTSYMRHHTHLDQNTIEFMRGTSDLLCDPGYQSWSGTSRDFNHGTPGHNTFVLNGGNQNNYDDSTQWTQIFGGQIENFFIGDKYGYSVASAALAYTDLTTMYQPIPEWRRSLVDMIDSNYYVLNDDYQTSDYDMDLVWQLHTKGVWTKDAANNAMVTTMDNDQLAVIFLNEDVNNILTKTGADYGYPDVSTIYKTLKTGKTNNNLTALLYPSEKGAALPASTYMSDADDNGVVVNSGSKTDVVLFHKDSTQPVVLSGAIHAASLGSVAVESNRVNKVVIKYTAAADTTLLQDGIEIGTLVGDGTERIDAFVLNNTAAASVTLSAAGALTISDVWSAATIKTDVADTTGMITLPNPDKYYDMNISYTGAQNAVVTQDGVITGTLPDGDGTATVQLQMPYTETVVDGVRTATADVVVTGTSTYDIKLAETENRCQIGRTGNAGGDNDTDSFEFNVPGVSVEGDSWSDKTIDGDISYRSGSEGANLYVNSPNTRNSYRVYLKYRASADVPVYQYKSMDTKNQITLLPGSSEWKVAAFDLKEYGYSAESIDKDQVVNRLLEFGAAIDVDSAWIELRDSDIQIDYNDVGRADDNNAAKHIPGLAIGCNFETPDMDARASESNGTILANLTDDNSNYYVNIEYTSVAGGTIRQLLDNAGSVAEVAEYDAKEEAGKVRFKMNGHYYDSNEALRAINVQLAFAGDITISEMWLDKEVRTTYDILDEVDYYNGSGTSASTFNPEKFTSFKPDANGIAVDGVLSNGENWNLDIDMSYGTADNEFRAKAGTKWDANNLYLAFDVTDDEDFDAALDGYPYDILDGDGLEIYIAKTRGLTAYDINTVQYCVSTLNGIYIGGGCVDRSNITTNGVVYEIVRNETGYTLEISIPWQSIGGMTVADSDKIGLTLHAYDKDTDEDQQTIGITAQFEEGDWVYPYYWPEITLSPDTRVAAESIEFSQETATMEFGDSLSLTAFVNPINSNDIVKFSSSDSSIATVDKWGNVRALNPGKATITAVAGDIVKDCIITVNQPATEKTLKLSKSKYLLGESITAYYTGCVAKDWIGTYNYGMAPGTMDSIKWSYLEGYGVIQINAYSDSVAASTGKFTADLCIDDGYEVADSVDFDVVMPTSVKTVTIDKSSLTLNRGGTSSLVASVNEDTTFDNHIVWSSSNTGVVAVDQNGRVLAMGSGTAVITATSFANGSKNATCTVTVNSTTPGTTPTPTPTTEPTVTPTPTPAPAAFKDVEGNWAQKAIMYLAKEGILAGFSDGTIKPNANATRAEFVTMIMKMMKQEAKETAKFSDITSSAWYLKAVSLAFEKGWVTGRPDGTFGPNDGITREEAIAIISRVIDSLGIKVTIDRTVLNSYTDSSKISSWAKDDVAKLVGLGIIKGSNNAINPKTKITRAEISTILVKIMEGYINK